MRCMIKAIIPHHTGNQMITEGTLESRIQGLLGDIMPEAAYFTAEEGCRTFYLFADLDDASRIPAVAEPLFLALEAKVSIVPCMVAEDLMKAGPAIKAAVEKYAPSRQFAGAR